MKKLFTTLLVTFSWAIALGLTALGFWLFVNGFYMMETRAHVSAVVVVFQIIISLPILLAGVLATWGMRRWTKSVKPSV